MTILRWCENNIDQIRTIVQVLFEHSFNFILFIESTIKKKPILF